MRIELISVDRNDVVAIRTDATLGYRGRFACRVVSGEVIFVPYSAREDRLVPGKHISVETDQESVSGFRVLPPDTEPQMEATAHPLDYRISGVVAMNTNDEVFHIGVDGFSFVVDAEETGGVIAKLGERVGFVVHGLSLWDDSTT